MTLSELRKRVAKVQEILSLRDWDVSVRWEVPEDEMVERGIDAFVHYEETHRKAEIAFRKPPRGQDVEWETIFHEALHLWFSTFDIPAGDIREEQAVCSIAKGLTRLFNK